VYGLISAMVTTVPDAVPGRGSAILLAKMPTLPSNIESLPEFEDRMLQEAASHTPGFIE
jgi:hypothetical protein